MGIDSNLLVNYMKKNEKKLKSAVFLFRKKRGLRYERCAELFGVTIRTIRNWEEISCPKTILMLLSVLQAEKTDSELWVLAKKGNPDLVELEKSISAQLFENSKKEKDL